MNEIFHIAGSHPRESTEVLLELKGICKSFGSVNALKMVDLTVRAGEVHAIVGENGAGKSTLVTIAAGALRANAGEIRVKGVVLTTPSVRAMRDAGVSIAYQHPALPADLTVLECLSLAAPQFGEAGGATRAGALIDRVATPMLTVRPEQRIEDLPLAQRHVVEIARALATDPDIIVLDEPTEPLQEADVKKLFELIGELKQAQKAVVYISHRLNDVMQIADRISILRDGELIDTRPTESFAAAEIVDLIVGRPLAQQFPPKLAAPPQGAPVLSVSNASGDNFDDVDLEVFGGEIVGLVGVEGQGQREFIRALAGAGHRRKGEVRVLGHPVKRVGRAAMRAVGVGFVPDDRHREGAFLPLSVRENLVLGQLDRLSAGGVVDHRREAAAVDTGIGTFRIKTSGPEAAVATLSGGNQQKVLFAREIATSPRVLLVDEPTKGVDVGSRAEIYQQLRDLSKTGVPILVCSSDGVELEGLCDRVLVFARGRVIKELTGDDVTDAKITEANLSATSSRAADSSAEGGSAWWHRLISGVHFPVLGLLVLIAAVAAGATVVSPAFLSPLNIGPALTLSSIVILVSLAQLSVILLGEFDLSVGPLTGLVVVMTSFAIPSGASALVIAGGAVAVLLVCMLIGFLQGLAVFGLRLPSIVVTLATFFGFQGLSLLLRPLPGGPIEPALLDILITPVLSTPLIFLVVVALAVALEWLLFRRRIGRELRASGSDLIAAMKLGVNRRRVGLLAFTGAGLMTGLAGLILAAQVGYGIAGLGIDYTLMSVTAVVLGGASIVGGRGSYLSTMIGALLVQTVITATPFFSVGSEWNYWITGATTLVAAGLFSLARPASSRD